MSTGPTGLGIEVRVLGGIEAVVGESVAVGGPTQRRVLAALALRRNEVVSVAHLVDVVWPDGEPPERAEHNVRTYVHRLRSALGEHGDRVETVGAGYRIRLGADQLDSARFEQGAGTATRLANTGDAVAALDVISEAEQVWRGGPLEEFEHETWAMPDVVRLRELHTELRTLRAAVLIELDRSTDAVPSLEALIREQPLRERPRALLMRALYESGRHVEALRAFQEFRRLLIDEVGVPPSAALVELDRAIAAGELAPAGGARSIAGYELHERIGEGSFAIVHRATQTSLGREVAVKIIRAELANRPEFIRRFEAEAQTVARIEHPNVVPLYDYWREPDRAFLVMRWMTGGSLASRLDRPWSLADTIRLVDHVASGLDAAHDAGVVHRDVKPENILFDAEGRAYLGDFGIALDTAEVPRTDAALSDGSPVFASPEQLRHEPAGPEADVHALAVVAFTLLTGRTPFADAADSQTLLHHQLHDPIPSIRAIRPELPERIDEVFSVATAKQPSDRYPTAGAFAMAVRAAETSAGPAPDDAAAARPRVNPYKGLRPFDESDAGDFHGRDRLVDELITHLDEPDTRLLAIVGPSGSGKSSAVRAGLVPALRGGRVAGSSRWFFTTMIPGAHPFEALERALLRVAVNPPSTLLDQLRAGDRGVLRAITRTLPDDDAVVGIVIDQFEELFTADVPDSERDLFLRALTVAASDPVSPARFILTLRADFHDRPLRHPTFAPVLKRHTVAVTPLAPDELEQAITVPASAVGVAFEPGLVAEIITDVNHEPGALPLLQYALTQVFDHADGATITIDDYRAIGGLTGALARRAEELWHDGDDDRRAATRRLFGRLVNLGEGTEDTARRVHLAELGADPATHAAIARYGRARLLTFDRDPSTREPTVEVAHEALIRVWPRLREWLDDDRDALRTHRHLTAAVAGWIESDRDPNELYRGARLENAQTLLTGDTVALNERETEFLAASTRSQQEDAAAERRRVRRLHRLVAATAIVALLALAAGAVAIWQRQRADDQAAFAERTASVADRERLLALARQPAPGDPTVAILLALEAHHAEPSSETLDALQRSLSGRPGFVALLASDPVSDVTPLDDGVHIVTNTASAIEVWNVASRTRISTWPVETGTATMQAFSHASGDGRIGAISFPTGTVVIELTTGVHVADLEHDVQATAVAVSPLGEHVAIGHADGAVDIYNLSSLDRAAWSPVHDQPVSALAWSPDGSQLSVGLLDGGLSAWADGDGEPTWEHDGTGDASFRNSVDALLYSSDGSRLVTSAPLGEHADESGVRAVQLLDASTGRSLMAPIPDDRSRFTLRWLDAEERNVLGASVDGHLVAVDLVASETTQGLADSSGRGGGLAVLHGLDAVITSSRNGVEIRSLTGSNALSRFVPLSSEKPGNGQPSAMLTAFDRDSSRVVTSFVDFSEPYARPLVVDMSDATLTPMEFPPTADIPGPVLVESFGPFTLHTTSEGFTVREGLSGSEVGPSIAHRFVPTSMELSPTGDRLVAVDDDGVPWLYDTFTGTEITDLDAGTGVDWGVTRGATASMFSPDGRLVAAYNRIGAAAFDADTGDWRWNVEDFGALAAGPGESWIAAADALGAVHFLDPATLESIGDALLGHVGEGVAIDPNPHQPLIATYGRDGTARVWRIDGGKQIGRELPFSRFGRPKWSPDGTLLAVPEEHGLRIWNYDMSKWADIACEAAGRNLTPDEWEQYGPRSTPYRPTCPRYPLPRGDSGGPGA